MTTPNLNDVTFTAEDLFRKFFGGITGCGQSQYFIQGDKMVRFSNHLPKGYNLSQNEEVKNAYFVFVNAGLSQRKIDEYLQEIQDEMDYENVENFQIGDNDCEIVMEYLKICIERFLS